MNADNVQIPENWVCTDEVSRAWDKSADSVLRLKANPRTRWVRVVGRAGGRGKIYFDPATIEQIWGPPVNPLPEPEPITDVILPSPTAIVHYTDAPYTAEPTPSALANRPLLPDLRRIDPEVRALWERIEQLRQQLAQARRGERTAIIEAFAKHESVSTKTVYAWLKMSARKFFKSHRADTGSMQIPTELVEATTSLWLHHPKASAWMIHRWLQIANPNILIYRHGNYERRFSVRGVRDIRKRLEANPITRAALMNEDERREFIRTWSGAVVATHPNELWQMDMTRCDVLVWGYARPKDTEPSAFRLRIHDCIDHYTGAIPALIFSREESRRPTTRLLILGLFPKPGGWNIFGKPKRIYHDNGSAYIAEATQRGLATLGIETSTSQAWVSHTRGKVENFHKLFHAWERTLPGYAGEDASQRNDWELARLIQNTRTWWEKGCPPEADPGRGNRLLLEDEYKQEALNWLQNDYHARILPGGYTRAELFLREVPAETQIQYNLRDLLEIFAESDERTVTGNGEIRWKNQRYTLPDGSLMLYQNRTVVVFEYEHPMTGEPIVNLYIQQPSGSLLELGQAIPAPENALSPEAKTQRRANKTAIKELFAQAEAFRQQYLNPSWRQDAVLAKGQPAEPITLELRGPKAELRRETPAQAALKAAESQAELIEKMRQSDNPLSRALANLGMGTSAPDPFGEE